ncbi:MAG: hypothetical protein ACKPKO_52555, partial [Candidatus Fonsibacter sp.]
MCLTDEGPRAVTVDGMSVVGDGLNIPDHALHWLFRRVKLWPANGMFVAMIMKSLHIEWHSDSAIKIRRNGIY